MPELEAARPPDRHCLLIDRGNSRVKWIGSVWHAMSRNWDLDVTTFGEGSADDLGDALDSGELLPPEEILYCSVADEERGQAIEDVVADRSSAEFVRLHAQAESHGIHNGYRKPELLGADRWMAVVGGALIHGTPLVVMDLGTGTTLDAIDDKGRHLGGLILPGPLTMLDSLALRTALKAEWHAAASIEGIRRKAGEGQRDTRAAVEGGIVSAQMGALKSFIAWFKGRLGEDQARKLKIVVTGGGAGAILKQPMRQSGYQLTHDPLLVFKGMLLSRYGPGNQ